MCDVVAACIRGRITLLERRAIVQNNWEVFQNHWRDTSHAYAILSCNLKNISRSSCPKSLPNNCIGAQKGRTLKCFVASWIFYIHQVLCSSILLMILVFGVYIFLFSQNVYSQIFQIFLGLYNFWWLSLSCYCDIFFRAFSVLFNPLCF